jgi:hypothetical protein
MTRTAFPRHSKVRVTHSAKISKLHVCGIPAHLLEDLLDTRHYTAMISLMILVCPEGGLGQKGNADICCVDAKIIEELKPDELS